MPINRNILEDHWFRIYGRDKSIWPGKVSFKTWAPPTYESVKDNFDFGQARQIYAKPRNAYKRYIHEAEEYLRISGDPVLAKQLLDKANAEELEIKRYFKKNPAYQDTMGGLVHQRRVRRLTDRIASTGLVEKYSTTFEGISPSMHTGAEEAFNSQIARSHFRKGAFGFDPRVYDKYFGLKKVSPLSSESQLIDRISNVKRLFGVIEHSSGVPIIHSEGVDLFDIKGLGKKELYNRYRRINADLFGGNYYDYLPMAKSRELVMSKIKSTGGKFNIGESLIETKFPIENRSSFYKYTGNKLYGEEVDLQAFFGGDTRPEPTGPTNLGDGIRSPEDWLEQGGSLKSDEVIRLDEIAEKQRADISAARTHRNIKGSREYTRRATKSYRKWLDDLPLNQRQAIEFDSAMREVNIKTAKYTNPYTHANARQLSLKDFTGPGPTGHPLDPVDAISGPRGNFISYLDDLGVSKNVIDTTPERLAANDVTSGLVTRGSPKVFGDRIGGDVVGRQLTGSESEAVRKFYTDNPQLNVFGRKGTTTWYVDPSKYAEKNAATEMALMKGGVLGKEIEATMNSLERNRQGRGFTPYASSPIGPGARSGFASDIRNKRTNAEKLGYLSEKEEILRASVKDRRWLQKRIGRFTETTGVLGSGAAARETSRRLTAINTAIKNRINVPLFSFDFETTGLNMMPSNPIATPDVITQYGAYKSFPGGGERRIETLINAFGPDGPSSTLRERYYTEGGAHRISKIYLDDVVKKGMPIGRLGEGFLGDARGALAIGYNVAAPLAGKPLMLDMAALNMGVLPDNMKGFQPLDVYSMSKDMMPIRQMRPLSRTLTGSMGKNKLRNMLAYPGASHEGLYSLENVALNLGLVGSGESAGLHSAAYDAELTARVYEKLHARLPSQISAARKIGDIDRAKTLEGYLADNAYKAQQKRISEYAAGHGVWAQSERNRFTKGLNKNAPLDQRIDMFNKYGPVSDPPWYSKKPESIINSVIAGTRRHWKGIALGVAAVGAGLMFLDMHRSKKSRQTAGSNISDRVGDDLYGGDTGNVIHPETLIGEEAGPEVGRYLPTPYSARIEGPRSVRTNVRVRANSGRDMDFSSVGESLGLVSMGFAGTRGAGVNVRVTDDSQRMNDQNIARKMSRLI